MEAQKVLKVLIYLGLLTCGLILSWQTVKEYQKGVTSYALSQESVTLDDLPTWTMCYYRACATGDPCDQKVLLYGVNFVIDVKVSEKQEKTVTLELNKYVKTLFGLEIRLDEMWSPRNPEKFCLKISNKRNGQDQVNIQDFKMIIAFKAPDGVQPGVSSVTFMNLDTGKGFEFMATTEDNSYGAAWDRYGHRHKFLWFTLLISKYPYNSS